MVKQKFFFEMISQLDVPRHVSSEVGRASFGRKRNSPKIESGVVIKDSGCPRPKFNNLRQLNF